MAGAGGTEVGRISIKVVPDLDGFRAELRRQLEAIANSLRATVDVNVSLDTRVAAAEFAEFVRRLSGATITVNVDLDAGRAAAQYAALIASMRAMSSVNIGVNMSGNGLSGGGITGMVAMVLGAAALIAPALALISGLVATIPALAMAALVPVAAIALGVDGIKEAFKPLGDEFQKLKERMNGAWFAELSKHMGKLEKIFSVIGSEVGLPRVASAMSEAFGGIVNGLTSDKGLGNIRTILNNVAQLIAQITPGLDKLTGGFLDLAAGVTAQFPAVGEWFNNMADSFEGWVEKVMTPDASGESPMERAMGTLGESIKTVLDLGGDLLKQGFEWLSDPNFGDSMKTFISDAKDFVTNTLPALGEWFTKISDLIGVINGFGEATSMDNLPKEMTDVNSARSALGIEGEGFDGFWTSIKTQASEAWSSITTTLSEESAIWSSTFSTIGAGIAAIWTSITTTIGNSFTATKARITSEFSQIGASISGVFNGVVATIQGVVSTIGGVISQVPGLLSSAWSSLASIASAAWSAVVSSVTATLSQVVTAVVTKAGEIVAELSSWPTKFVAAVGSLGTVLVSAGSDLVQGLINGITSRLSDALSTVSNMAGQIADAARSALGINSPSRVFKEIGEFTMEGLSNGLETGFDKVDSTMKSATDKMKKHMKTIGEEVEKGADPWEGMDRKVYDATKGFAEATGNQLMSDFGIGGEGAISQFVKQGIGLAEQTIFNVSSVDEALAANTSLKHKKSLQYIRR